MHTHEEIDSGKYIVMATKKGWWMRNIYIVKRGPRRRFKKF
jgi:hypothetical protein